ncbi:arylesterase [Altericroceibacterium spongiae]|uniref:Arylesterase n=1 Tax=Altericroceibacterium spongiae TaxID=2320269 RepID=A0A420EQP6_9SPHN|nr:arylesterase [Altericroceibacterium spongiae]RKF22970.1 arylesterase [Altericroceibacterium spongiae]
MRFGTVSVILSAIMALALSACGSDAPPSPQPRENVADENTDPRPVMGEERVILAFGDSLFAGYGLKKGESYPAKLETALRAKGINARIINAGVSGDTTAAGLQRIKFVLDSQPDKPDLALVELGGNDLLRGLSPAEARANLDGIMEELQRRKIPVLLMGMRAPANLGEAYQREFDGLYPYLAEQYDAGLVPFFLEAVADKPELIQQDHVHPTARGVEEIVGATADDVIAALPPED